MAVWRPIDYTNIPTSSVDIVNISSESDSDNDILSSSDSNNSSHNVRGPKLKQGTRESIITIHATLCSENHRAPIERTAQLMKMSYNTVKNIIYKPTPSVRVHLKKFHKISDSMKESIIAKIYESYAKNIVPTSESVFEELREDGIQIPYKISHFRALLREMGFKFRTLNKRQYIMESERIKRMRIEYLAKIHEFRKQKKNVVFLDETWFDTHDIKKKGLSDGSSKCVLKAQPSRGKRVIILHAGNENSWVQNGLLVSAKNLKNCNADYHEDMTASLFEKWFQQQLVPNLPPGTVIVMDNAPSHSRQIQKIPNTGTRKSDIIDFLTTKNVQIPSEVKTKKHLLQLVKSLKFEKRYAVEEIAKNSGHEILRLPPYFCIFNPIELIWADLKSRIRKFNFKPENSATVIDLIRLQVDNTLLDTWRHCVEHVKKVEKSFSTTPLCNININLETDDSSDYSV